MKPPGLTLLSYALLGLLIQKPASGYDLRKIFSETPMANLSDSPGAIYPALRRLEQRKLITSLVEQGSGLRRRRVLRVTAPGLAELKAWLKRPIEQTDIANRLEELMLRFAFFDRALGEKATLQFLQSFEAGLKVYIPELRQYLRTNAAQMPVSAKLALDNGLLGYEAQRKWVAHAINTYQKRVKSI